MKRLHTRNVVDNMDGEIDPEGPQPPPFSTTGLLQDLVHITYVVHFSPRDNLGTRLGKHVHQYTRNAF